MNPFYSILDPHQKVHSKPWEIAEKYLQLTDKHYAIDAVNGKKVTLIKTSHVSSFPLKILKLISFATVLAPLIALLVRAVYRQRYQFQASVLSTPNKSSQVGQEVIQPAKVEKPKVIVESKKVVKPPAQRNEPSAWIDTHPNFKQLTKVDLEKKPLSETGGFANAGNTCFINAVVQCLKNLPHLEKALSLGNNALPRSKDPEKDLLALKIRAQLVDIFQKSFTGKCISSEKMSALQDLMIEFNPMIKKGQMGDPGIAWEVLTDVLGAPFFYTTYDTEEERDADWYYKHFIEAHGKNWANSFKDGSIAMDSCPYTLAIRFGPTKETALNEQGFRSSCTLEEHLEIPVHKGTIHYRLARVVVHRPSHYIAYLKDGEKNQWVCFNDARVTAYDQIPENDKEQVVFAFYQRETPGKLKTWQTTS